MTACGAAGTSTSGNGGTGGNAGGKAYKIGVDLELTGPSSVWGEPQIHAVEMLVDEVNQKGGINGTPIQLIKYDNQSKETESLVVAKKLVEQDHVLAIIGAGATPTTMPLVPYVTQQKVPMVSVGSGDAIASPASERKWVFKTPVSNQSISKKISEYLKQKGWTRVGFLSVNNAYGESGKSEFEKTAQSYGIQIVSSERFGATDTDMKPQLTSVKNKSPDALVVWAIPPARNGVRRNPPHHRGIEVHQR
ncbi:ABC transporter substrate-binding protein [Kyrpidia tusciae]|uniref:ABC transporter substrate-binding protein n=1 Tax=Kyrpidia tusciae TaxID=33943 RepID=UPI001FE0D865|nr:ABC transporter substrate-binding protein [Kyrpidia tusciae]